MDEDLAALYRSDPQHDAIDVVAGWTALRDRLPRRAGSRRRLFLGLAAGMALAASVVLMLRTVNVPAVARLEAAWHAGGEGLQAETRAAIDRSLATIDRAIRDAEAALAQDPGNEYAADWLDTLRRRKLGALRQALSDLNL